MRQADSWPAAAIRLRWKSSSSAKKPVGVRLALGGDQRAQRGDVGRGRAGRGGVQRGELDRLADELGVADLLDVDPRDEAADCG